MIIDADEYYSLRSLCPFFLFIVFLERGDLKNCSIALEIVDILIFYTDEGPLSSTETLKKTLDEGDDLFVNISSVKNYNSKNPKKSQE